MCPDRALRGEAGFALMAALFIIVTLAAIAAYLLTISTGQVAAASQDEQAARAYQAARTGIEWAAYQVLINSSCPAAQNLPLPDSFSVDVACAPAAPESEGGKQITAYTITATGCNAAGCLAGSNAATYVNRQLQLTLSKCTSGC